MKSFRALLFCCTLLPVFSTWAQTGTKASATLALRALSAARTDVARDSANTLVKSELRALLDADGSFGRNYDSLPISRVDAPDHKFRLFTWNIPREDGSHSFEGFLLVNTPDKQTLFELRDMTKGIPSPEVPELGPDKWYGALYYQVIPVEKGGRTYYTLLGWKGFSKVETRKVIEVLSFRNGKPRFGAPLFGKGKLKAMRKSYGFSFQATMTLRYEPDLGAIVMDHLSPFRADMKDQPAYYGPDMTQDAYFWHKGEWWFGPDIDARNMRQSTKPFNPPKRSAEP